MKQEEIEIFENGKKQDINGSHSFLNLTKSNLSVPAANGVSIPTGTRTLRPENVRRTIAIVVDDLSLGFSSTFWVQQALRKYVNEQVREGDLVAIIRTGAGIGALQQFTMNKTQLLAAVDKIKFNLNGSVKSPHFDIYDAGFKENQQYRESIFVNGTLGGLNFVVRGMKDLPGRKSVVLLSEGIPMVFQEGRGTPTVLNAYSSLRRLIDFANPSSVVCTD